MILIYKVILSTVVLSHLLQLASNAATNGTAPNHISQLNNSISNQSNPTINASETAHQVLTEAGGRITLTPQPPKTSPLTKTTSTTKTSNQTASLTTHHAREGVSTPSANSSDTSKVSIPKSTSVTPASPMEPSRNVSTNTSKLSIPIYEPSEKPISNATKPRKIAPRKGVVYNETQLTVSRTNGSASSNATLIPGPIELPLPKKPTVTIPGEDEPYAPSHFQASKKDNQSSGGVPLSKVPLNIMGSDGNNNQESTQKYILPIVVVILSVPFVAILISMVYKRGTEWWKYRHYRRMDFLINGMYDN